MTVTIPENTQKVTMYLTEAQLDKLTTWSCEHIQRGEKAYLHATYEAGKSQEYADILEEIQAVHERNIAQYTSSAGVFDHVGYITAFQVYPPQTP